MSPEIERLIKLQEIETRAAESTLGVSQAPAAIAALDSKLTASRDLVAAVKQELADGQNARRSLDKDLIAAQQRLSKYKEQLMAVKTNAEYHAMQHQITAAEAEVARVEEQVLVNMVQADEIGARLRASEAALKTDEVRIAGERGAIERDAAERQRTLSQTIEDRAALVAQMERRTVELFERVFRARQGIAVAEAQSGRCTVCRVGLRPQIYNTILKNDSIVQCDHCQRILYFAGVHQRSEAGHAAMQAASTRQTELERPSDVPSPSTPAKRGA